MKKVRPTVAYSLSSGHLAGLLRLGLICFFFPFLQKIKSVLDETNKNATAGNLEENRSKNRSEDVIPFDRNRVILTPIGNILYERN